LAFVLPALNALTLPAHLGAVSEPQVLTWPTAAALPNFSDWQAGDLVLVKSDGSAMAKVIQGVQSSLQSSQPPAGDPEWTHVALYVDEGLVIESVPRRGIRYCPVHEYAQTRELRVRRLLRGGAPITPAEGASIAREASRYFEQSYSYWGIARHLFMQMALPNADQFFCSSYVAVVHTKALKVILEQEAHHRPLLPATLVNHPAFADLDLEWRVSA
jgi:Permuted papain-like amidase enzyme, YaeF/YiiX, C92 family